MSVKSQDQVELFDLLFGMSWEDPESDRRALAIQPGETLLTVTSGACNTLTLLLEDPGKVYAVDINPSQSHLRGQRGQVRVLHSSLQSGSRSSAGGKTHRRIVPLPNPRAAAGLLREEV